MKHRPDEYDRLFEQHYAGLRRYLVGLSGDPDLADDLAQEAFFRLLKEGVTGEDRALRVWLFRVATNLLRDDARTATVRKRLLKKYRFVTAARPTPDAEVERAETIRAVREGLAVLKTRDRTMLLMRHAGFTLREIAKATGVANGSVGTMLARAERRFMAAYEARHGAQGGR